MPDITHFYRKVLLIRKVEEKIALGIEEKLIQGPCHLSIGQEAIPVGISAHLRKTDRIFGTHRSHAHLLALGGDPFRLFSEVLGKSTGYSGGFGGSMHLSDPSIGFYGSAPIVAGTIPLAVGAALAAQKDGRDAIAVSYFGDGATEEGAFHESLNLSAHLKVPVLFVCENNLFSSHLHVKERQPSQRTTRFARAHHVRCASIDGNSVPEVYRTSKKLIDYIRKTGNPAYLETFTYRLRGHVGNRVDLDVGLSRKKDLEKWKKKDPLTLLENQVDPTKRKRIDKEVTHRVEHDWQKALQAPQPHPSQLLRPLFFQGANQ